MLKCAKRKEYCQSNDRFREGLKRKLKRKGKKLSNYKNFVF